jgi:holo-[acyl-carrier-protein] synthase
MAFIVAAHVREVVAIADVQAMLDAGGGIRFTAEERHYAETKSDPSRRLAARWAAKVAAARALGADVVPEDVEVQRTFGAPRLRLSGNAARRLESLSGRLHVSLTHGLTHAAASVVLETGP